MMKTAMELIEMLKEVDPMTPIVVECDDMETGWHYKGISTLSPQTVRMTQITGVDAFDGTVFRAKQLMSCPIEKPNAFKVLVLG